MSRSTLATTDPLRGEIDASRARLVEAADEARRRLERDLHDGAQQRFVLATIWLERAATRARGTPAEPLVDATSKGTTWPALSRKRSGVAAAGAASRESTITVRPLAAR